MGAEENQQAMTPREIAERRRGTVIAKCFRVEDLIAFDGMGALYRCRDLERGRPCALRVLPESYTRDPELTSRFMRDAMAVTKLGHPNIVEVLSNGRLDDGSVFSAMQLLHGQSIAAIIREEGRLSPSRAVHVASQVCRALGTAHEHGLIHRDLKPESIILTTHEGDLDFVKVVDFGICKQVDSEGSASSPDLIIGTPDYMAPEQAAGAEANAASDIYALGCVLFEMLAGQRPFSGRNSMDVLKQKGSRDAPRVTSVAADVPEALASVIASCLARRPEDRPESMRVLELELMRANEVGQRGRSETSALSPLPPPPEAGTLRAPTPVPPAAPTPVPPTKTPAPSPVSVASAPTPAPPVSVGTSSLGPSSHAPLPPTSSSSSSSGSSGAGLAGLPEPDVAADKAGRSIVPIAILGAVAVAVVLFVWPGVLRERGEGSGEPATSGAGVVDPPKTTSPEVASQGSDVAAPATGGQVVAESGADAASASVSGGAGAESAGESAGEATASAGVVADSGGAPSDGPDLVVLVGKLELAAAENRWRTPADDNVALHLARIEAIDPKHESIARIEKQAAETLKARAEVAAGAKHWHDAVEAYRDLFAINPEFKPARKGFGEALAQEAKILRLLKDPEQMLQVADDMLMLDDKSFDAQMMRGEAYEALSKWREATEAFAIAKRLKPKEKAASDGHARVEKKAKAMGLMPPG